MALERYTTATLLAMLEEIQPEYHFYTNLFFPTQLMFETQSVEFDIVRKGRRLAPFVAPTVRGKPMMREGFRTESLKPAYIKPMTSVDVTKPLERTAGEEWHGSLSPQQRMDRLMAQDMKMHQDMLDNRIEWMACQTIYNGGYNVSGEDYPDKYVDFGQSTNLNVALAGAATWDQTTSSPLRDIEQMALQIQDESFGAVAGTVIMDNLAWSLLREHADVKDLLDLDVKRMDQSGTNFDLGIRNDDRGFQMVGTLAGRFTLYTYNASFEDDDGVAQQLVPDYSVVVAAPRALEGKQAYGAILDADANWSAQRQFFKSREQWDPSGVELLSMSAPLIFPKRINTWGVLTVA